jgi:catechol 1,2-dioxygenase
MSATRPEDITAAAVASFDECSAPRVRELMRALTRHLHAFVTDVRLTRQEWERAIAVLTETGRITDEHRQEFILWSDALGLSMLVDALASDRPPGATESTVVGPFWAAGSPLRGYGESISEQPGGEPLWVHGTVRGVSGEPVPAAEIDVWQNAENRLYAGQDPDAPEAHLRGRFRAEHDGGYAFLAIRPTPYPIPADGPVGEMLEVTGRHPWRPAHLHVAVHAAGYESVATHIFDADSDYLASDAVFAVKPSLIKRFQPRDPGDPDRPPGISGPWFSLHTDLVLAQAGAAGSRRISTADTSSSATGAKPGAHPAI